MVASCNVFEHCLDRQCFFSVRYTGNKEVREGEWCIMNEMHNKNEGFTLVELIIVVAIMGVLIALLAPSYARHVEKSRETVDIANVRSAYAEIMAEVMDEDASNIVKVVKLKQKRNDWQAFDPVVIAGKTHYKSEKDTDN